MQVWIVREVRCYLRSVPNWRRGVSQLCGTTREEELHIAMGVRERYHRFREVSGVPAIEAAAKKLNARLAARGASVLLRLTAYAHVLCGSQSPWSQSRATRCQYDVCKIEHGT